MENRQYKVNRNQIHVGEVVIATALASKKYKRPYDLVNQGELYASGYKSYRSMLFVPNQDLLANDLLYNSPYYPALNISKSIICWENFSKSPIVTEAINIGDLLKYFGYAEELGYSDILKIRKKFFNYSFIKDNCELFGYKKVLEELDRKNFEFVGNYVLDSRYFQALNLNSDRTISDLINGYCDTTDAFKPHKEEALVRKLTL